MQLKKAFLIFGLIFGLSVSAQKIGVVNSEFILKRIPEYNQAQAEIEKLSSQWNGEVEAIFSELAALQKALNAEKVLLTDEMIKERQEAIAKKEKQARDLQRKYFAPEGELYKKRKELVTPIQDQVFNAIQDVARSKRYDLILDKANVLTMLYVSEKMDISEEVLSKLGYR